MSKKKKKNIPSKSKNLKSISEKIIETLKPLLATKFDHPFSLKSLYKILKLKTSKEKDIVKNYVIGMQNKGEIAHSHDGFILNEDAIKTYQGVVDHVNPRFAYIVIDGMKKDVWVKTQDLNYAIDGDVVEICITKNNSNNSRPEGIVKKIISRKRDEFIGCVELSENFAFVIPENKNIHFDIFVPLQYLNKAKSNQKVLVKILDWHNLRFKNPIGKVVEVLGHVGDNNVEMVSILLEMGLPYVFPKEVESEAHKIPEVIPAGEYLIRKDFRNKTTFTIDPEDAKDFDDALSIEILENGNYEVGVHIADVSHYVKVGSALDKEAYTRGTSVYLVDRTVPMLPEKLSNQVCSLRPDEEKLTFSTIFEVDKNGNILKRNFHKTVIKSNRRFAYEEVQKVIDGESQEFQKEIKILNDLALILRKKRFENGSINFESVELKFKLDEEFKPIEIIPKERKEAHKMIEEWMLIANKSVAEYIFKMETKKQKNPFVYRTHDGPDLEKLENFLRFAAKFGYTVDLKDNISKGLNKFLEEVEGKPEQNLLSSVAIKSMAKARYTTHADEHFGLAFEHYTHFTSPIRRYPDVMVHRLLFSYLNGETITDEDTLEKKCIHCSEREKAASDGERASVKYKQVEFMQKHLGEVFEGIISGVTDWGIYVEIIATKCEGMIKLNSMLEEDRYEIDTNNFRVVGKSSGKTYTLGDHIFVQVVSCNLTKRNIDLEIAKNNTDAIK